MAVDEGARIKKKGDPEEDSSFSNNISAPERRRVDRWPAIRFDPTEFCDRTGGRHPAMLSNLIRAPSIGAPRRLLDRVSRVYAMTNRP